MIELKNVVKIYNNYNNNKVTALKGANLKFASTGLVFIAGPSGGGKSTLLNIISGIDVQTGGEMFVNGVSTEKLGAKGFDGYRNNFVGIIHQDLHLLDHLTFGQNVALAMELQGLEPNMGQISILFNKLGIGGMEDRYPNQCSVGQCQRAAIARTLVKKPKLLVADEPTSSVDPETRMEIYELLKDISKEVLVIAATHNRDMVDRFADRLIMIENGNVTADILSSGDNSNIAVFDQGKVVAIEPGTTLTACDIDKVNDIIRKNNKKGVFLCLETDAARVQSINPNAAKEIINSTLKTKAKGKEQGRQKKLDQLENTDQSGVFQFEKGHLPAKVALKLSMINFTGNWFRSVFTILLSALAMMFFALTSSMGSVNKNNLTIRTFADSNDPYITFSSNAKLLNQTDPFGDNRVDWVGTSGEHKSGLIYDFGKSPISDAPEYARVGSSVSGSGLTGLGQIYGVQKITCDDYTQTNIGKNKYNMELVAGRWPKTEGDRTSVVISDFVAAQIRTAAYLRATAASEPSTYVPSYEDMVKEHTSGPHLHKGVNEIWIDGTKYNIVGIYKTAFKKYFIMDGSSDYFSVFPDLVTSKHFDPNFIRIRRSLSNYDRLRAEYLLQHDYVTAFVSSDFIEKGYLAPVVSGMPRDKYLLDATAANSDYYMTQHSRGAQSGHWYDSVREITKTQKIEFISNEQIIDGGMVSNGRIRMTPKFYETFIGKSTDIDTDTNTLKTGAELYFSFKVARRVQEYSILPDWTETDNASRLSKEAAIHSYNILSTLYFTIDPALLSDGPGGYADYSILLAKTDFTKLTQALVMPSTSFIASGSYSEGTLLTIFDKMGSGITPMYADSATINNRVTTFDSLSNTMTTVSVALAIFIIALMYNYIFQSIRSKRKNIAVIRSMGARTWDVFKIFILEAIIIAGSICFLTFLLTGIATSVCNAIIHYGAGMRLLMFGFDALFMLLMLGSAVLVIGISYMLPVFAYARHNSSRGLVRTINSKSDN